MTGILLIFILALVLFGPKKTYALAMEAGKYAGMMKRAARDLQHQLDFGTHPEPVSYHAASAGEQQIIFSPSNLTLPGRNVEDISNPLAPLQMPTSAPVVEQALAQEDAPRAN